MNVSVLCITASLLCLQLPAHGQTAEKSSSPGKRMMKLEITGDHYMIQGLGALLTGSGDTVEVKFMPPKEALPKDLAQTNIETGDFIAMLNGKKVASVKDFEARYDAIAVGGEVKLGIRRGMEMVLASFTKPDKSSGPQGIKVMTIDRNSSDDAGDAPEGDIVLGAAGIGVAAKAGQPAIVSVFPPEGKGRTGDEPHIDDVITKINNKPVATMDDFVDVMDTCPMGTAVTITFSRNGKSLQFAFTRGGGN